MPTLFTDPRSGGVKKNSGVQVLPIIAETWAQVRDESDPSVDWLLAAHGTASNSNTVTLHQKGNGGIEACSEALPDDIPVYGGVRLQLNQRFVTFFYAPPGTSILKKGKASMQKNGVLNILEGSDCEIDMKPNMTEDDIPNINCSPGNVASSTFSPKPSSNMKNNKKDHTKHATNSVATAETDDDTNNGTSSITQDFGKMTVSKKNLRSVASKQQPLVVMSSSLPKSNSMSASSPIDQPPPSDAEVPSSAEQTQATNDAELAQSTTNKTTNNEDSGGLAVPYSSIKGIVDLADLPPGVDPLNREESLSKDEFQEVFGMSKEAFRALPGWKRTSMKKAKQLF